MGVSVARVIRLLRSWPLAAVTSPSLPTMKELIYHRLLLPAATRNANRPCTTDAATGETHTYAEHFDETPRSVGCADWASDVAIVSP